MTKNDSRKARIRSAAAAAGISYTSAMRLLDELDNPGSQQVGPVVGDSFGSPVRILSTALNCGVAVLGDAGTGKTELIRQLFQQNNDARTSNARIVFASSTDEAYEFAAHAPGALVIDVGDNHSWYGVNLDNGHGSPKARAERIVAMIRSGQPTKPGARTVHMLMAVLTAAIEMSGGDSPLPAAGILLGADGDNAGVRLAAAYEHSGVSAALAPLYGPGVTAEHRASMTAVALNRINPHILDEQWVLTETLTWDRVLETGRTVIVNVGRGDNPVIPTVFDSLIQSVERTHAARAPLKQTVTVYIDELRNVGVQHPARLTRMFNALRAGSMNVVLATQFPEQLPEPMLQAALSLRTLITFANSSPQTAERIVQALTNEDGGWSASAIARLPRFTAVIRSLTDRPALKAFVMSTRAVALP